MKNSNRANIKTYPKEISMIIVSNRKNFTNSDIERSGLEIRNITADSCDKVPFDDFLVQIHGQKVLILVHGYNNNFEQVIDAYEIIERKMKNVSPNTMVIGFAWPSGDAVFDWWSAKAQANSSGTHLAMLLNKIKESSSEPTVLDIMSHSLGGRVTLKCLKSLRGKYVRNYYCTAGAVDNEALEPGEEFNESLEGCKNLFVMHSKYDGVLKTAYRIAEFDNAIGIYGPEDNDFAYETDGLFVVNCKKVVKRHGGYKNSQAVYNYIAQAEQNCHDIPSYRTLS